MKTVINSVSISIVIKKSEFIAVLAPVRSMEEAMVQIKLAWEDYPQARHIAWAVKVGNRVRMNDDGEPSGTAGMPILSVIQHNHLEDVLILVIRYFGGIKLGAGGLTRAYRLAASQAVELAEIVILIPKQKLRLTFEYAKESDVRRVLDNFEAIVLDSNYENCCQLTVELPESNIDELKISLTNICLGDIHFNSEE